MNFRVGDPVRIIVKQYSSDPRWAVGKVVMCEAIEEDFSDAIPILCSSLETPMAERRWFGPEELELAYTGLDYVFQWLDFQGMT